MFLMHVAKTKWCTRNGFENEHCWRDDGSSCEILIIIFVSFNVFMRQKFIFTVPLNSFGLRHSSRVHVTSTPPPHILFDSIFACELRAEHNDIVLDSFFFFFFFVSSATRNGVDAIFMVGACARRAKTGRFPIKCARKTFSFNLSVQMPSTDWLTDSAGCRCLFVSFENCI